MHDPKRGSVAIVGLGAVLPDAPSVGAFWKNLQDGRYSITETPKERWDADLYYDPDPKAPDKLYSKIGGWVREYPWEPFAWKLPIPPKVGEGMDRTQKWAVAAAREALEDYGYPNRPLDPTRTAVIVGNAMGGDRHYQTALRIYAPEYLDELARSVTFAQLPEAQREAIAKELLTGIRGRLPEVNEDSMPGELANIIAGRIAAIFDFHGPNFVTDAACASAMAAMAAAVEGLEEGYYDTVVAGGVDANMSASTFVKFCKIGALSATGTRPYDADADGFVMGEGAALFVLKRIADAERDGDRIYAVLRGIGGASDGKGKGITAPNPVGQRYAVVRGWEAAGERPDVNMYYEGHGTSTRVGDVVEANAAIEAFAPFGLPVGSVPLGSVKSNIGHLKGAAGAAGIMKAALSLFHKEIPPSINVKTPNPKIDFARSPFRVVHERMEWKRAVQGPLRAGVSAFGFGGTNFHAVLEEHEPGRLTRERRSTVAVPAGLSAQAVAPVKAPLRGLAMVAGIDLGEVQAKLRGVVAEAKAGRAPAPEVPDAVTLAAPVRLAVEHGDAAELARRAGQADKALASGNPKALLPLRAQGVHLGRGEKGKVAFLFTGQGSQYVNMLRRLAATEPVVRRTFEEADAVMTPILGRPLTSVIFADDEDEAAMAAAGEQLRQTAITQPAVLTVDIAMTRLMAEYGVVPDMVMGHSLGEYGALVAAGGMPFAHALEAVAARGAEMTKVSVGDNGKMAAVMGPMEAVQRVVDEVEGYVVVANINSRRQAVIGGHSDAVERAVARCQALGYTATFLPVSHAFHTSVVAPASGPLMEVLRRLDLSSVQIPLVGNVTGEFYPTGPGAAEQMVEILGQQIAAPVQFVRGLETLYGAGARVFVEVGPKKALHGMAEDVFEGREDVVSLFTNHPKLSDEAAFNQALAGIYAAGAGRPRPAVVSVPAPVEAPPVSAPVAILPAPIAVQPAPAATAPVAEGRMAELGRLFTRFMEDSFRVMGAGGGVQAPAVVISGAAVGLPGAGPVFRDDNVARLLHGEQFIDSISMGARRRMVDRHITRLVKTSAGSGSFEVIESAADTIKLAGQLGDLDLVRDFGFPPERMPALDVVTKLAIGAGVDALRDAGLPLVMHYKTTTRGTLLPERWMLPDALRDETGVIFGSAFPGYDALAQEMDTFRRQRELEAKRAALEELRGRFNGEMGPGMAAELARRIQDLDQEAKAIGYALDRRFLFRILAMGHSQFAEYIGARGPNTQVNAACASGTQALGIAQDWIRSGRCRRVIVVSADDVTSENLLPWIGSGFLASGAAATDELVEEAALPFDRRRHGLLLGMGAAALVVESEEACLQRGLRPIARLLGTRFANSAFHGTRLDPQHITREVEALVAEAEAQYGLSRHEMAKQMVFVSHETFTPARGGSAQTEVRALREVFGPSADHIVVANTKGMTGHAMGTGIEDVLGVKALETGLVPPVANFREVDPELGTLNLSKGGAYPVQFALRLAAGFGSQLALSLTRWVPSPDGARAAPRALGFQGRIQDPAAWQRWVDVLGGRPGAELEVVQRTLRIKDQGAVARPSAPRVEAIAAPAPVAPVVAAPRVEAPAPAPVATAPMVDPVRARIMAIVAEQTGYPADMLDPELDLEADLGIDTVKQAETFAAVREAYGIERDPNLSLRDFNTLEKVVGFVYSRRPELKASSPVATAPAPAPAATASAEDPVRARIMAIVAEQTGYPAEMLDPELDLEADLGIDTVKQAEVFVAVREAYGIERDPNLSLRDFNTLEKVVGFVYSRRPELKVSLPVAEASLPAPVVVTPAPAEDPVRARIMAIVAEQTGYPAEMLDPELDLEADLGIDTVKQAEVFVAVREAYGIERDANLSLRDFNTLEKVVGFVYGRRPDLRPGVPAAAPASTLPVASAAAPSADDEVRARVLGIIAEQTGYPAEMLDPELDLEADLGIDTVKQAEVFVAVREAYGIERDPNLSLRDFNTINRVVEFVHARRPSNGVAVAAAEGVPVEASAAPVMQGSLQAAAAVPRRVPVSVLRLPLAVMKPTGVTLAGGDRVVVMADGGPVADALAGRLEARGVKVLRAEPTAGSEAMAGQIAEWQKDDPIAGVYWLPALEDEGAVAALSLAEFAEATRRRVKLLHLTARALYEDLAGAGRFLISATRMGGAFGLDARGVSAPLGGAVAGFTKAFARERPEALVKVVDFELDAAPDAVAAALVDEAMGDPGAVEIGRRGEERSTVRLQEIPVEDGQAGLTLTPDSVFLVTGAAGSITSAIVADLAAAAGGGVFYLLDLAPEPNRADPDLVAFHADPEGLKRTLFERLSAGGEKATPAKVNKLLAGIEREAAALAAVRAVEVAGGIAHYRSVNLMDHEGVQQVVAALREAHGHVDVVLHAGGLEISRFLPDKTPEEFALVFDVKAQGWYSLLSALGDMTPKATVVFSSIAGRFGNAGQADYAAANELLAKTSVALRARGVRAMVMDWTAWGGIGMATRGSIPTMMARAGIEMLPPEAGIAFIRRELTSGGRADEVVVAGALGVMLTPRDDTGGLLQEALPPGGPMVGRVMGSFVEEGLVVEVELDPSAQPFLDHHRIDGTPVLPGVMGLEAFAEVARLAFPDRVVAEVADVAFLAPFKFYRSLPRTVKVCAQFTKDGDDVIAHCVLCGERSIAGQEKPQRTLHFKGAVRLSHEAPEPADVEVPPEAAAAVVGHDSIYDVYFHGPAYRVLAEAWANGDRVAGKMAGGLGPNHAPAAAPLALSPRLVELCFQTAGVGEIGRKHTLGLPSRVARVRHYKADGESVPLFCVVRPGQAGVDAQVVDAEGRVYVELAGYETESLPVPLPESKYAPLAAALS